MACMPMNSVATAESSTATSTRARLCSPTRVEASSRATTADHHRAADRQHQRDVESGEPTVTIAPHGGRLRHADDECQQAPRDDVVDGRAGQRHDAHRRALQAAVAEDAREDRERRDRHRHAEKQGEGREGRHPAAPASRTAASASAAPSAKGTTMPACEIAIVVGGAAAQRAEIELEADQEHVEDHAELCDHVEERRRIRGQEDGRGSRARCVPAATVRAECRRRPRRSPPAG